MSSTASGKQKLESYGLGCSRMAEFIGIPAFICRGEIVETPVFCAEDMRILD